MNPTGIGQKALGGFAVAPWGINDGSHQTRAGALVILNVVEKLLIAAEAIMPARPEIMAITMMPG